MLRFGRAPGGRERARDLDDGCRAAGVVIRAVEDVVAAARSAHAQVIVMSGDEHVGVRQSGVGPAQHADHVAQFHRLDLRSGDVRRDRSLERSGFGVASASVTALSHTVTEGSTGADASRSRGVPAPKGRHRIVHHARSRARAAGVSGW